MMEELLTPGDSTSLLYRSADGKKFNCTDYFKLGQFLTQSLFESTRNHDLHVDWTSCHTHPLIFDIDVENSSDTFDILMRYFDSVFLKSFEKHMPFTTLLLSMRKDFSGGMHVHVLNVEMAHDDYVHLCNLMQTEYEENGIRIKLDCPASMSLVACDKSNSKKDFYVPVNIVRIQRYFCEKIWKMRKIVNVIDNFEIASCMMPVPEKNATYLKYPTRITHLENNCVAKFKSCLNDRNYAIVKENKLVEANEGGSLCYNFLKQNAKFINPFVSFEYKILKTWYKRFSFKNVLNTGIFQCIDDQLRIRCVHLKDEDSPLNTLLHSEYFLPVFYSLCNLKRRKEPKEIAREIHKHFSISSKTFYPKECTRLDFDTILYCAFKTVPQKTKEGFYLDFMGWDWIFESTRSVQDLKSYLKFIQKRYYPIVKCFENGKLYSWDPCLDVWLGIYEDGIVILIKKIYNVMKSFKAYSKMPKEIQLNDDLIYSLQNEIIEELEIVQGAEVADLEKYYGHNVPQYYFFNYKLDAYDTCC